MPFNLNRSRPRAYLDADLVDHHRLGRVIVMVNSRGAQKISPAEARELAAELIREAEKAEAATQEKRPCN